MAPTTVATAIVDFRARSFRFSNEVRRVARAQGVLQRDLQRTERAVARFNRRTARFIERLTSIRAGLAGLAAGTGLGLLVRQVADATAALDLQAEVIGVSTTALQELRFAGQLLNIEQRQLDIGLQRFSRRLGEAAQGAGVLAPHFERLGISLRDTEGALRPVEDVLGDYAEGVRNAASDSEQLALAFAAFDSEGARLVNLLREGRDGVAAYRAEARALGIVLGDDVTEAARSLSDAFARVEAVFRAGVAQAVLEFAPQIEAVLSGLAVRLPAAFERLPSVLAQAARALQVFVAALVAVRVAATIASVARFVATLRTLSAAFSASAIAATAWGAAMSAAAGPIGLLVTGLAAIAGGVAAFQLLDRAAANVAASVRQLADGAQLSASQVADLEETVASLREEQARLQVLANQANAFGNAALVREYGERLAEVTAQVTDAEQALARNAEITAEAAEAQRRVASSLTVASDATRAYESALARVNAQTQRFRDQIVGLSPVEILIRDFEAAARAAGVAEAEISAAVRRLQGAELLADFEPAITGFQQAGAAVTVIRDRIAELPTITSRVVPQAVGLFERWQGLMVTLGNSIASAFAAIVSGGQSAADALRSLLASISAAVTRALVLRAVFRAFDIDITEAAAFVGPFASGGVAPRGVALVGERGPELIDLRTPARVYTAQELGAALRQPAAAGSSVEINISGVSDGFDVRRAIRESLPEIATAVARFNRRPGTAGHVLAGV